MVCSMEIEVWWPAASVGDRDAKACDCRLTDVGGLHGGQILGSHNAAGLCTCTKDLRLQAKADLAHRITTKLGKHIQMRAMQ